jgi:hypothetical protein
MRTLKERSRRALLKRNRSEWELERDNVDTYGDWDNFEGRTIDPYGHSPEDNLQYPRSESRRMIGSGHSRAYQNPDYNDQNFWHRDSDRQYDSASERYGPEYENLYVHNEDERYYPLNEYEARYGGRGEFEQRYPPEDRYRTIESEEAFEPETYSTPYAKGLRRSRLLERRYEDLYEGGREALFYRSPYEEQGRQRRPATPHRSKRTSQEQGIHAQVPRDTAYSRDYEFGTDAYPRHRPNIREKQY